MKPAEVNVLHSSDFYQIRNYKCNCTECHTSGVEYTTQFNFCFVRSGYFEYQVFRNNLEAHVGRMLLTKPSGEHKTRHIDGQPDVCSVFYFSDSFFAAVKDNYKKESGWFFENRDLHTLLLRCSEETEYVHHQILSKMKGGIVDGLLIDDWVLRLVDNVMRTLGNVGQPKPLSASLKRYHLNTISQARQFILANFNKNITLQQLADHCCVSIFHFSRLFKTILCQTPYQYITEVRMSHASILLETTNQPIAEVAFQCGFSSAEHFATYYKQRFKRPPSANRKLFL